MPTTEETKTPNAKVRLVRGFKNEQIEFPEQLGSPGARKSGTVHFTRNRVVELSPGEAAWLEETEPELFAALEVLPAPAMSNRAARRFKAAADAEALKNAKVPGKPTKAKKK